MGIKLKDHEKFISFILLGFALVVMAVILYLRPIPDSNANSGVLQILNLIIGAIISAFGSAVNALFRISDSVKVDNVPTDPVPVAATPAPAGEPETAVATGELPEQEKISADAD